MDVANVPPDPSSLQPTMDVANVLPDPSSAQARITDIPDFIDARYAATDRSKECTLILLEGKSAKTFLNSGFKVVDSDLYAVLIMTGKPLNVSTYKDPRSHPFVQNLVKILGLEFDKVYEDVSELRYGRLLLMADQDYAGSHIKGLIINIFDTFWRSLLQINMFMKMFITPIVKASKLKQFELFYSMQEYEKWMRDPLNNATEYQFRYYKGLGTIPEQVANDIFQKMEDHTKNFIWSGDNDATAIRRCFSRKLAMDKKRWILEPAQASATYNAKNANVTYEDFINFELRKSGQDDILRLIPSLIDGLIRSQRKVLFTLFGKECNCSVSDISGIVAEHTFYLHGNTSLDSVIIHMAQNFVGSNNINLLDPDGNFGSRAEGGSNSKGRKGRAAARYCPTLLSSITRHVFPTQDDKLLEYKIEGGISVEPKYYYPIIPMILVNGCNSIATCFKSVIPNYNPLDIIDNLIRLLEGESLVPMDPWYRGYKGNIRKSEKGYITEGVVNIIKEEKDISTIAITELPVNVWTDVYKDNVLRLELGEEILSYVDCSKKKEEVHIQIQLSRAKFDEAMQVGLLKKFKLHSSLSLRNMHVLDENGALKLYNTPEEILLDFFPLRLALYKKRKRANLFELRRNVLLLHYKAQLIQRAVDQDLMFPWKDEQLKKLKFPPYTSIITEAARIADDLVQREDEVEVGLPTMEAENEVGNVNELVPGDYDYLNLVDVQTFSDEGKVLIEKERDEKNVQFQKLGATKSKELWLEDLRGLRRHYLGEI